MSEYRDELAAAHARIAELEEKLRVLEEEARPASRPHDGRFPELEAAVTRLRAAADPTKNARKRTNLSIASAVFPLLGMVLTFLKLPILATCCSVIFMAFIAAGFHLTSKLKKDTRLLHEAEAKLGDARKIAELEAKLTQVRVDVREPLVEEDVESERRATAR
jgi:hypothetical protein